MRQVLGIILVLSAIITELPLNGTPRKTQACERRSPNVINQVSNFLADDDEEEQKTVAAILNNFAGMIGNLVTIAQDPHNPVNVASNLGNLITGIGHIVAEALKRSLEEQNIPPQTRKKIMQAYEKHLIDIIKKSITKHTITLT